ncbi:putative alpha-galactosidase [Aspergillus heteromorphus CBS 117.55]|uniref:Alpha-galactosidase n=1 Tax=Aspergillus heteromorphus CBS 117.55 TaxID=1448321 RepID=A0A317WP57_9EURO|nr:putative alpha-galactosidase [Aspergillus heteromorphus CBS 117.55]PWY88183.1 putative alpha-galactosidase [Aspergillus heteromorphus CBS 117.55]
MAAISMFPLQAHSSIELPSLLPTPPMGFNNWSRFMCDLNETLFTETADAMVSNGLLSAGYNRINIDDCWMAYSRSPDGSLQWNTTKFPHGIPWLAEYVKTRGFHLGIYEDSGNMTCGGYPGSYEHEETDAQTFASWGIDYLKLDGCNVYATDDRTLEEEYKHRYGHWHSILANMTHPLIFSESAPAYFAGTPNNTNWYTVMDWVPIYGELARHSTDILVYSGAGSAWDSIMVNYNYNTLLARYQQPGYFNDPDFLIPDHPGLTGDEKRSHFALWASFSAPLIISAYIPALSTEEIVYLSNRALIAVDQDALAQQATLASRDETLDVLTRSLANGDRLLTVLNRGNTSVKAEIPVSWLGLGIDENTDGCVYSAQDLWDGSFREISGRVEVELDTHATAVFRISLPEGCRTVVPTGIVFNTASGNCLTAGENSTVAFETCQGQGSQIWQVEASGTISPLSRAGMCLTAGGESVSLQGCASGSKDQGWTYAVSGNLKNEATGGCLTEGVLQMKTCLDERNEQVFGLPSGVDVS